MSASPPQKDADRAVVVALTSRSVFESTGDGDEDMYGVGVAFPLLKVRMKKCVERHTSLLQ